MKVQVSNPSMVLYAVFNKEFHVRLKMPFLTDHYPVLRLIDWLMSADEVSNPLSSLHTHFVVLNPASALSVPYPDIAEKQPRGNESDVPVGLTRIKLASQMIVHQTRNKDYQATQKGFKSRATFNRAAKSPRTIRYLSTTMLVTSVITRNRIMHRGVQNGNKPCINRESSSLPSSQSIVSKFT